MKRLKLDSDDGSAQEVFDLTNYFEFGKGSCFGLDPPEQLSLIPKEAGLQANRISFCAHASGTHTECSAHILGPDTFEEIFSTLAPLQTCLVIHIKALPLSNCGGDTYEGCEPCPSPHELVICKISLQEQIDSFLVNSSLPNCSALVLQISGDEWVFFTDQAMIYLAQGVKITSLLVNRVSVDREECGKRMPAHTNFFKTKNSLITENIKSIPELKPGFYQLNLQLCPIIGSDAVPSRVILINNKS